MDMIFSIVKITVFGIGGLLVFLVVCAILFGKRVHKRWEYDAEFRDSSGREFGELDMEFSKVERDEPQFTFKAHFKMRHPDLNVHDTVRVAVEDTTVLEGRVEKAGEIRLRQEHVRNTLDNPSSGQVSRVFAGSRELAVAELVTD